MERKVGEIFFNNHFNVKLQVVESTFECEGCYFNYKDQCIKNKKEVGYCCDVTRKDYTDVIFKEIK